jgi:hypothetical protein
MLVCVIRRRTLGMLLLAAAGLLTAPVALAQSQQREIDLLKKQLEELRQRDEKTKQQLEEMQRRLEGLQSQPPVQEKAPADKLEEAVQELPKAPTPPTTFAPALASQRLGGVTLRLIDLSLDVLAAAGGSTVGNTALQNLEGGDHDPRWNGFTLQNVELSLAGAVDPYFTGETHLIFFVDPPTGDTTVELEEAFLTTTRLPFGLQVKAGFFFTEFGLINPTHPHAWHWQDQPVINTRLFGPDGMRQAGLRVGWLLPVPWASELFIGAQNANGEIMASFLANEEFYSERPIGGRPFVPVSVQGPQDLVYFVRWVNFWNLRADVGVQLGGSAVFGPNASGPHGRTTIYGGDLKVRWRPANNFRGWPFLLWESELMQRNFKADSFDGTDSAGNPRTLPAQTLYDWGLYTQLLYGFSYRWVAGVRFEYASGSGASVPNGREADPFRDNRYRVSPLLVWHLSEFSRLRLQYNYDRADHLTQGHAHTVWFGVEFLYGAHPAHNY